MEVNRELDYDDDDFDFADRISLVSQASRYLRDIFHWGWVVVFASFICIAMVDGTGYTIGILLDSLQSDLGGGKAEVAVAGSLQVGVYSLSGPLVGKLISRFGARPVCISGALISSLGLLAGSFATHLTSVYISYSVVTGIGFGLMYLPSVVGVAPYFSDNRALAIGICLCGSGVGTFGLAPVSAHILEKYGWRWVFRTFSILCMACTLCGAVMVPVAVEQEDHEHKWKSPNAPQTTQRSRGAVDKVMVLLFGKEIAHSKRFFTFILATFADFLAFVAIYIPYTYLPPLAKYRGIPSGDAAFLISAGGISNTVGRLVGGWLSDQFWTNPLHLYLIAIVSAVLPSFVLPSCAVYWTFLMSFGFFGFVTGSLVGCTSPMLVKLLGLQCLSQGFGLVTACRGVAALVGPPSAGILVDTYQFPGLALYLSGFLLVASTITSSLASIHDRMVHRRSGYTEI